MTIRFKISLLIALAGVLSSLVFSGIILIDMTEQPIQLVDSELQDTSRQIVSILLDMRSGSDSDRALQLDSDRYWLTVYDMETGAVLFRSRMAQQIDLPPKKSDYSGNFTVVVPPAEIERRHHRHDKLTLRVRTFRIIEGGREYKVIAGRSVEHLEEEFWETLFEIGSGLAFSLLLLVVISYFVAGLILRPIRVMNDRTREINENLLDRRLPVSNSQDEFNSLAGTLNRVFDRLHFGFNRQKRLIADASHELKTPLTIMRLTIDNVCSGGDRDLSLLDQGLARISDQVRRMERLVKSLLDLSSLESRETIAKEWVDLESVLSALIDDYRILADVRRIRIDQQIPRNLSANGNRDRLIQAFSNIIDNAIKYNIDDGNISVTGILKDSGCIVSVTNSGPGVAGADIAKVFDQFYRVEQSRSAEFGGFGLGLALVKRIVELHDGHVSFESQPGEWTRVTIDLP